MRLSTASGVRSESGPNMTALVDVVMVILIFLMLAGTMGSSHFLRALLPQTGIGPGCGSTVPRITVQLEPAGDELAARVGGSALITDAERLTTVVRELSTRLQAASFANEPVLVTIYPHRQVKHEVVVRTLAAVNHAGVTRIAMGQVR